MKRILLVGLLVGGFMLGIALLVGWVTDVLSPSLMDEYENKLIFRPWSDPIMSLYFIQPFILGIILTWIWRRVKNLFGEQPGWKEGIIFGMIYWLITIPGILISYSTFQISFVMTISWGFSIFLQAITSGILLSQLIRNQ